MFKSIFLFQYIFVLIPFVVEFRERITNMSYGDFRRYIT
ncbi:Uncharacterised protein [Mycobacteroides abscessus subsp. abscessus]|nr:Uncharacterised protein [Mycobacteroides abscessus subsp. abscessus]